MRMTKLSTTATATKKKRMNIVVNHLKEKSWIFMVLCGEKKEHALLWNKRNCFERNNWFELNWKADWSECWANRSSVISSYGISGSNSVGIVIRIFLFLSRIFLHVFALSRFMKAFFFSIVEYCFVLDPSCCLAYWIISPATNQSHWQVHCISAPLSHIYARKSFH